jgi:hypothetical protein
MANLFTKKFMQVPKISGNSFFKEIGRNAYVDWLIILFVNVVLGGVLVFGGLHLYWQVSTGNFVVDRSVAKIDNKIFNEKDLENVLLRFEIKDSNIKYVQSGYFETNDPSL